MNKTTTITVGIFGAVVLGWSVGGYAGAAGGFAIGLVAGVVDWWGQPLWVWLTLWHRRSRPVEWSQPLTVANDRAGGGVRFQGGFAAAAVQLLGKPHAPTVFTGSAGAVTDNELDLIGLKPLLRQSLDLRIHSISFVCTGARRRNSGDFPRVYDTLIGTPPYAGRRQAWLIVRIAATENADALQARSSIGTATLAAAQRISAAMRQQGIRAKVATATDIVELERRLGRSALQPQNRRWRSLRSDAGWLTTYRYRPADISAEKLGQAWSWRADGITQNVTLFGDGSVSATVTVRSAQPPTAPPSVLLQTLPGEQVPAITASLCGPMPRLRRVRRGKAPGPLPVPIGPSGVLLGKSAAGGRLLLPLDDAAEISRVHLAAEDSLAMRVLIRLAATGERITVYSHNTLRWNSVRMPDLMVSDRTKPVGGTTVGVVDGTLTPTARPNTLITVTAPGTPCPGAADVVISQVAPGTVDVMAGGQVYRVEIELFRAENRYACTAEIQ